MKRLVLLLSGLALAAPDIAIAQQQQRPDRPGASHRPPQQRPPQARPPQRPAPLPARPPQARPPQRPTPPVARPPQHRPPVHPGRPGAGRPPQHRPGAGRPPNFRPVHGPSFRYPRGYRYRRWSIGLLLPSLFLSSAYYYDNWGPMGIGAPPPGYRWVRYGPDLLLVQIRTGRIADVIYGAFY